MPLVMSLEGPQIRPVDRMLGKTLAVMPKPWVRRIASLTGLSATVPQPIPPASTSLFAPFKEHPLILLLGLAGGLWYAARRKS